MNPWLRNLLCGGGGGGGGGFFPGITDSELYLPLTNTLVPTRGASTPTFTRATAAWDFDSEGKLNLNIPSGCPRFTGARLVRNLVTGSSEDFTIAAWTKGRASYSAGKLFDTAELNTHRMYQSVSTTPGTYTVTVEAKAAELVKIIVGVMAGGEAPRHRALFDLVAGSASTNDGSGPAPIITQLADGWFSCQVTGTCISTDTSANVFVYTANSSGARSYLGTGTDGVFIRRIQVENVSGQADQTASEYVSVGVLSAPFHGAGADGCKWFNTEKSGGAIPSATLKGYWAEPSRVNNCLNSRLIPSSSTSINPNWYVSGTVGSELVVNGGFDSDTVWSKGAGWAIAAGVATATASNTQLSQSIGLVSGKTYTITVTATRTAGFCFFSCGSGSANRSIEISASGSYTLTVIGSGANATLYVGTSTFTGTVDDISVKESAIQVTQTTGLDNVANSASRLTAAANDATLLQLLTAPTGTRTTSAWIKRVSGSGTVSLTRNGGTGWTDITSSLVTDTWVPVEVVSDVGANPTVGLKMGTSGDVIDVDCFQDENGAWRTSPILTTTAAVTRNADVLSYNSAFDVAQGTSLCTVKSAVPVGSSMYAIGSEAGARLAYWSTATARAQGVVYDGTTVKSVNGLDVSTGLRKRACRWGPDLTAAADGTISSPSAFDGSMGAGGGVFIGCSESSSLQLSGNIGEVHIWNSALTDAQMQQVTS